MHGKLRGYADLAHVDGTTIPQDLYTLAVVLLMLTWAVMYIGFVSGIFIWIVSWLLFIMFENTYLHSAQVGLGRRAAGVTCAGANHLTTRSFCGCALFCPFPPPFSRSTRTASRFSWECTWPLSSSLLRTRPLHTLARTIPAWGLSSSLRVGSFSACGTERQYVNKLLPCRSVLWQ